MLEAEPECPFCRIVNLDNSDVREIFRDENVVAFFPTKPAVLGHLLVVPRKHIPNIWELDNTTASHLAGATTRLANLIRESLHPDGLNIIQSNGAAATQTVFHLHVHLVPRYEVDAMGPIWPKDTSYSKTETDSVQNLLRQNAKGMVLP